MVKIYQQPFAHAGTKQVIPDASDPQGFVSNADGFTSDYELPDTDPNYKPIERSEFNGLMNMVTEAVGELQQFGFAKWQPITWPQGARVIEGGVVYRALAQTSQKPPHADWVDDMAALNNTKANISTQVIAGTGLSGGGDLSANRTLSVNYGTTAGTAAQGNDSRIANSVQTSGNQTIAGVKTFSSFPVTPSAAPTNAYQMANKKYVDDKAAGSSGIGVGQTWQDVKGSRDMDVTYTNSTGRVITVSVSGEVNSGHGLAVIVSGVSVAETRGTAGTSQLTAAIPSGATYRISRGTVHTGQYITKWSELR